LLCGIGILINSSRTGLVAAAITSAFIIILQFAASKKTARNIMSAVVIALALIALFSTIIDSQLSNRATESLLEENGRLETYIYGFSMFFSSAKSFFIGSGLSLDNYTETIPHNFLLETLVNTGVIVTAAVIVSLVRLLKYINNYENKYIIWCVLIGSMMITNFQGNIFVTIYIIIAILITAKKEGKCTKKRSPSLR
jgi:hypothetical protein